MYDSSECMLRMMTAGGRGSFCVRAATSMPFIFGMPTSTIRVSGSCSSARRSASIPSEASATTLNPASVSSSVRKPRRTMP